MYGFNFSSSSSFFRSNLFILLYIDCALKFSFSNLKIQKFGITNHTATPLEFNFRYVPRYVVYLQKIGYGKLLFIQMFSFLFQSFPNAPTVCMTRSMIICLSVQSHCQTEILHSFIKQETGTYRKTRYNMALYITICIHMKIDTSSLSLAGFLYGFIGCLVG